jgi:hypothetical protein
MSMRLIHAVLRDAIKDKLPDGERQKIQAALLWLEGYADLCDLFAEEHGYQPRNAHELDGWLARQKMPAHKKLGLRIIMAAATETVTEK